ncbi:hypothetical protein ACIRQP_38130 [Streptomyces sp. NPDC102274]|uniref:hypothetical protein n=1 Tax=Streptomyces sp. NPDC102274 TaxID=3366151 RepID=UPI003810FC68
MKISPKKKAIGVALVCTLLGAGVFGYLEIFTKGLDKLPAKVCDGAIDRKTAASALPDTRKALERGVLHTTSGGDFMFSCYVKTNSQDSIISGEAETHDASVENWSDAAESRPENAIKASAGNVEAITWPDRVTIYVPCTPPGKNKKKALESHALIAEARTIGDTRATGAPLRQAITDFAYQLIKHAYKAGKCQEAQEFPDELSHLPTN